MGVMVITEWNLSVVISYSSSAVQLTHGDGVCVEQCLPQVPQAICACVRVLSVNKLVTRKLLCYL